MNEHAKAWVAALRSGEFAQGYMRLRTVTKDGQQFCCLGVACELYRRAHSDESNWSEETTFNIHGMRTAMSYLPIHVMWWLGMKSDNGCYKNGEDTLTNANDNMEYSFKQIADIIEQNESELFK